MLPETATISQNDRARGVRPPEGRVESIALDGSAPPFRVLVSFRGWRKWGSEWAANTAALKADLLANYPDDSNIVPPLNDDPVSVNVQFMPISINSIDTVGHTFSIFGWWRIWWSDERLAWNASQYGGVDSYLDSIGFDKSWRKRLREKLLE